MKYSFTFETVADYLAAKNSSGSGNVIYTSLVTNSGGYVSRTAISTIQSTGQTFVDAVNVIVPREKGGEIGDTLLYKGGSYYWLKGNIFTSGNDFKISLGGVFRQNTGNGGLTTVGYIEVGYVGYREGGRCLIFKRISNSLAWAKGTWTSTPVPGLGLYGGFEKYKNLHEKEVAVVACFDVEFAERRVMFNNIQTGYLVYYCYPIKRTSWNKLTEIVTGGATSLTTAQRSDIVSGVCGYDASQSVPNVGYGWGGADADIINGEGVITFKRTAQTAIPVNLKTWNYDFDLWNKYNQSMVFPALRGGCSDMDGRGNTRKILAADVANATAETTQFPSAFACHHYSVDGVPDFHEGSWWFPSAGELLLLARHTYNSITQKKGITEMGSVQSSTQSTSNAYCSLNGSGAYFSIYTNKTGSSDITLLACSEFII